jgi:6-pyruvoyl-tetrahydropterin synthase
MKDTDESSDIEFTKVEKRSSSTGDKKKVEIQISAISTPKGEVPTVKSLERVVDGLNILDSEFSEVTEEIRKNVLFKIKDLEKDITSMKKLVSETAISIEATFHKINDLEPKLGKAVETVESQKTESAELARYIGAITNNLRREFSDNLNMLEKKLSEEIKKTAVSESIGPMEYSVKLDGLQNYLDNRVSETSQLVRDTKKTVEGLREDLSDLVKFLGDTLAGLSRRLDAIPNPSPETLKAAKREKERVTSSADETDDAESVPP